MASRPPTVDRRRAGNRAQVLRALPPIDACMRAAQECAELGGLSPNYVKLMMRRAQAELRAAIGSDPAAAPLGREAMVREVVRRAAEAAKADRPRLRPVINATGVVIHTNLGRALLAEPAIEAVAQAARSFVNLEYDLESGGRGEREALIEEELCALTGAEAATVVNNNAAAVLLALNSLAEGREVIVSRGELVEIGGSFRLPEVMVKSGARLREVGTTNRTHARDYLSAIGPDTALLLKVHPSNYRVVGFTAEVALKELVEMGGACGVEVVEDLGSGALVDLTQWGLPREPVVAEQVAAGAGLVTFSGDKLLGGPQAGLAVGKRELVAKLKSNPLRRALRCDKLTLAALSATLRLYLRAAELGDVVPTLRLLKRSAQALREMAHQARALLSARLGPEFSVELADSTSEVGAGSLPTEKLASVVLRITHPRLGADAIAAMFRRAEPPVIGRISGDAFQLDLRTVETPVALAVQFAKA